MIRDLLLVGVIVGILAGTLFVLRRMLPRDDALVLHDRDDQRPAE